MMPQIAAASAMGSAHGSHFVGGSASRKAANTKDHPVDLVHLARQSLGDRSLEAEILQLFRSQSVLYVSRLRDANSRSERRLAAHTILGSSRGIGAWKVARLAQTLHDGVNDAERLNQLEAAVLEANAYIATLLDD